MQIPLGPRTCAHGNSYVEPGLSSAQIRFKPVFHSRISPPLAKNFDIEIIFLHSCVAEEICSVGPVVENFHLLVDLSLTARKNNYGEIFRSAAAKYESEK